MSKLVDIIKRTVNQEIKAQNNEMHVPCIIERVSDDYLRADVSLLSDRSVIIKNRLNKSGEKLTAGQQAWLYYTTLPSSGYIGRTEGEADPIGGGGATATVENAAVLLGSEFHDYLINETLMLPIQMPTALYYGRNMTDPTDLARSFVVVQGHLCVCGQSSQGYKNNVVYDSEAGRFICGGADGLFEAMINNKSKFGSVYGDETGYGFLCASTTDQTYPDKYVCNLLRFTSATTISDPTTLQRSTEYAIQRRETSYDTTAPEEGENWWEISMSWDTATSSLSGTSSPTLKNSSNGTSFDNGITEIFMVANVIKYNDDKPAFPFGYVEIDGFYIFAQDANGDWGVCYTYSQGAGGNNYIYRYTPLISKAEQCYFLGLSKKTEPQTT